MRPRNKPHPRGGGRAGLVAARRLREPGRAALGTRSARAEIDAARRRLHHRRLDEHIYFSKEASTGGAGFGGGGCGCN